MATARLGLAKELAPLVFGLNQSIQILGDLIDQQPTRAVIEVPDPGPGERPRASTRREGIGPPDDVVGAGGWLGGGELIYEVISCAGCWEWLWVKWCGAVGSDGAVHAARHVGQAPWPARYLGLSGSQSLRGQGRPQAVAQRSR